MKIKNDDCARNLAAAIVQQAARDYGSTARSWELRYGDDEIERFFHSEWFVMLVGGRIDGPAMLEQVKKNYRETGCGILVFDPELGNVRGKKRGGRLK